MALEPTIWEWEPDPIRPGQQRKRPGSGTKWKARYRDEKNRSHSKTFDTKTEARRFLEAAATDIRRGDWIDPLAGKTAFDEFADDFENGLISRAPATQRFYGVCLRRIRPRFADRQVASIDRKDVRSFVAELVRDDLSPKTIRNVLSTLGMILDLAVEARAIKGNPARGHRLPRGTTLRPQFLTAEEVQALADGLPAPYGIASLFLAYTGLRPSELCGLRLRSLDLVRGRVAVVETLQVVGGHLIEGPTKTGANRAVPLPPFLVQVMAAYLSERRAVGGSKLAPDDFVFVGNSGGPVRETYFMRVLKRHRSELGLPSTLRVYDLRHTYASLLISEGVHVKAIAERMGHSSITVTMDVYGHLLPSIEGHANQALERLYQRARNRPEATVTRLRRESR